MTQVLPRVSPSQILRRRPYTLDHGLANDCLTFDGICNGQPVIPGIWEMPMYAIFDERGVDGPHLMDPWLDSNGNDSATLSWMQNTFTAHYNGNRQPFGLYTHPIHVATGYPGIIDPTSTINMINAFLDWAQEQPNVWIVSNMQLLEWVRNPVTIADLNSFEPLKCPAPQVSQPICNGIPSNEAGLLQECPFSDFPFFTCYGCPSVEPSPDTPDPPQVAVSGKPLRTRLPANCSTPFWDPVGATCLCSNSNCQFVDSSRPIGPNGANLTGGGTGGQFSNGSSSSISPSYVPFSGAPPALLARPTIIMMALMTTCAAMVMGVLSSELGL